MTRFTGIKHVSQGQFSSFRPEESMTKQACDKSCQESLFRQEMGFRKGELIACRGTQCWPEELGSKETGNHKLISTEEDGGHFFLPVIYGSSF